MTLSTTINQNVVEIKTAKSNIAISLTKQFFFFISPQEKKN